MTANGIPHSVLDRHGNFRDLPRPAFDRYLVPLGHAVGLGARTFSDAFGQVVQDPIVALAGSAAAAGIGAASSYYKRQRVQPDSTHRVIAGMAYARKRVYGRRFRRSYGRKRVSRFGTRRRGAAVYARAAVVRTRPGRYTTQRSRMLKSRYRAPETSFQDGNLAVGALPQTFRYRFKGVPLVPVDVANDNIGGTTSPAFLCQVFANACFTPWRMSSALLPQNLGEPGNWSAIASRYAQYAVIGSMLRMSIRWEGEPHLQTVNNTSATSDTAPIGAIGTVPTQLDDLYLYLTLESGDSAPYQTMQALDQIGTKYKLIRRPDPNGRVSMVRMYGSANMAAALGVSDPSQYAPNVATNTEGVHESNPPTIWCYRLYAFTTSGVNYRAMVPGFKHIRVECEAFWDVRFANPLRTAYTLAKFDPGGIYPPDVGNVDE